MSRSWRRRMVVLVLVATLVGVIGVAPAMATWTPGLPSSPGNVTPTVVSDGRCSKVGSTGTNEFKVTKLHANGTYTLAPGVSIKITVSSNKKSFDWVITGGRVHDVTALGLLTPFNHYDYGATPQTSDGSLHAPLIGNKSTTLVFGYICWSKVQTFSISGTKKGADGSGLPAWTINLYQGESTTPLTATTDVHGRYKFEGLAAGTYRVCEVLQSGWVQTSPGGTVCSGPSEAPGGHAVTIAANATSLDFVNAQGVNICEQAAQTPDNNATFTVVPGTCAPGQVKVAQVTSVVVGDGTEILFTPTGSTTVQFTGTLTFNKAFSDPNLVVLRYDPDGGTDFRPVPACLAANQLPTPNPGNDSWCYFGVTVTPADSGGYKVVWQVFGVDDPRFK